jgi:hypothetical protein
MPGPSNTWSAFGDTVDDALAVMNTDRIMTIITERLDESLVVARHYLQWSLADMVVTVHRKALSTHPKANAWPADSIQLINDKLQKFGEYKVYDAGVRKLDERIHDLKAKGIDIEREVTLLKEIRTKVTKVSCFYE